jgi:tRNA(fMet)-specific endonuclease VapC
MSGVLVDTDVFSYILKGDLRAQLYRGHVHNKSVHLSFMTVAELYRWTLARDWGPERIESLGFSIAACTVLTEDTETRWNWARIMAAKGRPRSSSDAWVAAIALRYDLPLITHNAADFIGIDGLTVISEA